MRIRSEDENNNFTLLRLLLSLAVVLGHFKLLQGTVFPAFPFNLADAAVDCFFIVSGFLIALSYERTRGLLPFYVRRVFRLYPMYAAVVLLQTAIMMALLPNGPFSEPRQTLHYVAANLLFANFLQYDIGGVLNGLAVPGINPSLWTLKIELGFYLFVPLIFAGIRRWGWKTLAVIFAASVLYNFLSVYLGEDRLAKQLPGQMQFFAVGMGLYLYARNVCVPFAITCVVTVAFLLTWTLCHPIPPGIRPLVVAAFVFCFALCSPVVQMRTDMSYSVYLLHGPFIQTMLVLGLLRDTFGCLALVVSAVLLLSFVAEILVERPGNELGRRLARRKAPSRAPAIPGIA